jgi:hypothetical protein
MNTERDGRGLLSAGTADRDIANAPTTKHMTCASTAIKA